MKIICDTSLRNFEFWSGAKNNAETLTCEQLDTIEHLLEGVKDEWTDTEINDMFWFDTEFIAELLGFSSWDNLIDDISNEDVKDADLWAKDLLISPTDEELNFMAEKAGLTEADFEECDEEEREERIVDEFEYYWDNLSEREKFELYNNG